MVVSGGVLVGEEEDEGEEKRRRVSRCLSLDGGDRSNGRERESCDAEVTERGKWRLEASRIHPPLAKRELISTFIRIQEGIYLGKFLGACPRSFPELIEHVKEIEDSIQAKKIIDDPNSLYLFQEMPSDSRQSKKRKSRDYTQLMELLSSIFFRLHADGMIKPRKEEVVDPTHPKFDLSKRSAFHSNAQGHDIEEHMTLKHKVQNLIDANKLKEYQSKKRNTPLISNKEKRSSVGEFLQKSRRFNK
ncbi:hypothetical protein HAX54_047262 [Datura stramonium]|uniref:Uncharacterized protein n=1 Tax=Datura stramonium TaxID=4076 RepID=A0ABS8RQ33_DATST|nr:hypothetical protein [Datura stramonium]